MLYEVTYKLDTGKEYKRKFHSEAMAESEVNFAAGFKTPTGEIVEVSYKKVSK